MIQDKIFAEGEGDRWFARNADALVAADRAALDPILRLVKLSGLSPRRILEVGASNGYRLHELNAAFGAEVTAVEPSQAAIDDGQRRYPSVRFLCGLASAIPIADDYGFDLVIVNFVLHWVDRSTLLRSLAEIDRMVADGGYLAVGDFYPAYPERVVYHHLPEANVSTFKQSYSDVFVATNLYEPSLSFVLDHSTHRIQPDASSDNRSQVCLLRKSLHGRYAPHHSAASALR